MIKIEEIESAVSSLSTEEYRKFRQCFFERDWSEWDGELKNDAARGRLDFLCREAAEEKRLGRLKEL